MRKCRNFISESTVHSTGNCDNRYLFIYFIKKTLQSVYILIESVIYFIQLYDYKTGVTWTKVSIDTTSRKKKLERSML